MAPVRTTRAVVTSATIAAAASVHASAPARNGNWPPCGNSTAAAATGTSASAASTASRQVRSCRHHAVSASDGEDDPGDRAGRCCRHDEDRGGDVAATTYRGERRDGDGQPEGERQTSDRDVDHGPGGEQQARRQRAAVAARQVVEAPGGGGAAGDGDGRRSDRRAEHREQHAVPGRVMAGEPQVVPDRRAELDPQQLRRPVGAAPSEPDGGGGERRSRAGGTVSVLDRISRRPCWS